MKKILAIISCIAMIATTAACGKDKKEKKVDKKDSSSIVEVKENNTSGSSIKNANINNYDPNNVASREDVDKNMNSFLDAMKNKDMSAIEKLLYAEDSSNTNISTLLKNEILNKVTISDYSFKYENDTEAYKPLNYLSTPLFYYSVTLDVSESSNPQIKQGKSEWIVGVEANGGIMMFMQKDEVVKQNSFGDNMPIVYYCRLYQEFADRYPKETKSGALSKDNGLYIIAANLYITSKNIDLENTDKIKADDLNKYIQETFNFKDFDIKNSNFYNKDTNNLKNINSHFILQQSLTQSVSIIKDGEFKEKANYYADSLNMLKTKTVEYTVSYSNFSQIKVLSAKVTNYIDA